MTPERVFGAIAAMPRGLTWTAGSPSPTTLADALTATAAGHRPVAGGTDLVVGTRQGKWSLPENLVAIDRIAELRGDRSRRPTGLRIGATTSHAELAGHPAIRERWTAIADAASIVGSPATRHVGTLGGNLANASPAAETSGPLLCFDAQVEVRSTHGRAAGSRSADLFSGPGRTTHPPGRADRRRRAARARRRGQLLRATRVPAPDGDRGRRRDRRRDASRAASSVTPGSPSPPSPRPSGGSPRPRQRSSARMAGPQPRPRRAGWRPRPRRRSPTSARRSTTAGRWRPSSSGAPSRVRSPGLAARRSRSPPAPACSERVDDATIRHAPGERDRATRWRSRPAGRCCRSCAASSG